jgi:hypothetical protein
VLRSENVVKYLIPLKIKRMREAIVSVSTLSVSQGAVSMNEKKLMAS